MASGQLTSSSLDQYVCIALAGVAVEFVEYGQAEGGLSDIQQLDALLSALRFTEKKAQSQVRWAALNTCSLIRRHKDTHVKLVQAMREGLSVGDCIKVVEEGLRTSELV